MNDLVSKGLQRKSEGGFEYQGLIGMLKKEKGRVDEHHSHTLEGKGRLSSAASKSADKKMLSRGKERRMGPSRVDNSHFSVVLRKGGRSEG